MFGAVTLWRLERDVLSRVGRLSRRVTLITAEADPALRVDLPGGDELSRLARDINGMLQALERADAARQQHLVAHAVQTERLAVTLRSIGDGVIATDVQGRIQLMNGVAEELTGCQQDDAIGRPLSEVFPMIHHPRVGAGDERESGQELVPAESMRLPAYETMTAADGRERTIALTEAAIKGADGRTLGAVYVIHDLTERRRWSRRWCGRGTSSRSACSRVGSRMISTTS